MIRLRDFMLERQVKQNEIAELLGVSQAFVSNVSKGINMLPKDKEQKLIDHYGEDIESYITLGTVEISAKESVDMLPLMPISAQGGTLNDFVVSVRERDCERIPSPIKGADFAITVAGDSMSPDFPNGSTVLIKKINEQAFIDWGKAHVLDTCNGVVVKILVPSDKDGYVRCVSINKDPIYAPFDVSYEDIFGIYVVKMCMSLK